VKVKMILPALTEAVSPPLMSGETLDIADSYNNLAILAVEMGRIEEADRLQTESVAMASRLAGPLATRSHEILRTTTDRVSTRLARSNIAGIKLAMGLVEEAQAIYEEVLREALPELGPTHTQVFGFQREIRSRSTGGNADPSCLARRAISSELQAPLGLGESGGRLLGGEQWSSDNGRPRSSGHRAPR
jgi:Tetratricopeptide repeat